MKNDFASTRYWENRYKEGRNSGVGSYGKFAKHKSEVTDNFIKKHKITSMIDLGCGDGNQAGLIHCTKYIGFDVSETAIEVCNKRYKDNHSKVFTNSVKDLHEVDLTISYEVIFHLLEFDRFIEHLQQLFKFSKKYVIIFSSNEDSRIPQPKHVKHRKFTSFVSEYFPGWRLTNIILSKYPKECFSDFYIYEKGEV